MKKYQAESKELDSNHSTVTPETLGKTGNWVLSWCCLCNHVLRRVMVGGKWGDTNMSVTKHCTHKSLYDSLQKRGFIFFLFHLLFPSFSPYSFLKLFKCPICLSVMGWTVSTSKFLCWSFNPQCLRTWPYLKMKLLKEGIKLGPDPRRLVYEGIRIYTYRRKTMWRHREKMAIDETQRKVSGDTNSTDSLAF